MGETIYTIDSAKLNKCEIDILHFANSWLPTFDTWSVRELGEKCNLFEPEATEAVDMLILHGLMENAGSDSLMGRTVRMPPDAVKWIAECSEQIDGLQLMNDSDLFDNAETAEA